MDLMCFISLMKTVSIAPIGYTHLKKTMIITGLAVFSVVCIGFKNRNSTQTEEQLWPTTL